MDRDDVIRIARAAGLGECLTTDESADGEGGVWFYDDNYIKQVELFFRAAYAAGVAAERDALLSVLEKIANVNAMDYEYQEWARAAIDAVRREK